MITTPPVSCMCLTYGRPHLLEEAIFSFLNQDYSGEKELIVLNDFIDQELIYNHPQVKIINVNKRFKTVGEKRNAAAALSTYDILAPWDDDDIFLKRRLSFSIKMYDENKRFFKPSKALILNNGEISGPKANLFYSGGIWARSLFDQVRGHAHMGSGQDMEIEKKFQEIIKTNKNYSSIKPEEIYYLYRWSGTHSYHLSAFGQDKKEDSRTGNEKVEEWVKKKIESGEVKTGRIELNPNWQHDYQQKVDEYLKTLKL